MTSEQTRLLVLSWLTGVAAFTRSWSHLCRWRPQRCRLGVRGV